MNKEQLEKLEEERKEHPCENCGVMEFEHHLIIDACKKFKPSNNLKVTSHSRFQEIYKELLEIMKKNKLKTIEDLENYSLPLTLEDTPEEKIEKTDSLFRSSGTLRGSNRGCGKKVAYWCGEVSGVEGVMRVCPECKKKQEVRE